MKQKPSLQANEQGFASIVVALVLITVLALLTIAFAQLARREQQNALNKQLSSQANYAAESGINDLYSAIKKGILTTATQDYIDGNQGKNCLKFNPTITFNDGSTLSNEITPTTSSDVSYSCALVNLEPPTLAWQDISPESQRWSTFSTNGSLSSLTVFWGSGNGHNKFRPIQPTAKDLGTFQEWNSAAAAKDRYLSVLEVSITPLDDNGGVNTFNRQNLVDKTFTAYLYPSGNNNSSTDVGGSVDYSTAADKQGQIINGPLICSHFSKDYPCSVTINNIPHTNAGESYLIRVVNHYDKANIIIGNAKEATPGENLHFIDGQAVIDVTGKARNVLKRLQVRIPLKENGSLPPSIEAQSICKRLSVEDGSGSFSTPATYGANTCTLDYDPN